MNQHILKQFNISVQVSLQFKADFSNVNDMKNKINSDILSRCNILLKASNEIIERVFDYFSSCRDNNHEYICRSPLVVRLYVNTQPLHVF